MYLVIDNSIDSQVTFHTYLNTKWVQGTMTLDGKSLLQVFNEYCLSLGKELKDIKGIAVVVGIGRFTSTRVATTLANALALSLSIPVLAVDGFDESISDLLNAAPKGIYISARYSAPANIGVKKVK